MPNQVYYNGDWYYAYEATTAGQSPETNPELWVYLPIPAEFADVIEPLAAAMVKQGQNQVEVAGDLLAEGRGLLEEAKRVEVFRTRRARPLRVIDKGC